MANVPLELIDYENVPVDDNNASKLKSHMEGKDEDGKVRGQLTPILICEVPGRPRFQIGDGFHRYSVARDKRDDSISSLISRGISPMELICIRVASTREHKPIQFVRYLEWSLAYWSYTSWADRISLGQALTIAQRSNINSLGIEIDKDELGILRREVAMMCENLDLPPQKIRQALIKTSGVDPSIVREARAREGNPKSKELALQHLDILTDFLPFQFTLQRVLVDLIKENNLNFFQTQGIAKAISSATDIDEARVIAEARIKAMTTPSLPKPSAEVARPSADPLVSPDKREVERDKQHRITRSQYFRELESMAARTNRDVLDILREDAFELGYDITITDREEEEKTEIEYKGLYGKLTLFPQRNVAQSPFVRDGLVDLTKSEAKILGLLLSEPKRVFYNDRIAQEILDIYELNGFDANHLIRVNMSRLRKKLGDENPYGLIYTIAGRGYSLTSKSNPLGN